MTREKEFLEIKYKEGSLEPKVAALVRFAACLAVGNENGATLRLGEARKAGATEDEVWETAVYAMRPSATQVRNLAKKIVG